MTSPDPLHSLLTSRGERGTPRGADAVWDAAHLEATAPRIDLVDATEAPDVEAEPSNGRIVWWLAVAASIALLVAGTVLAGREFTRSEVTAPTTSVDDEPAAAETDQPVFHFAGADQPVFHFAGADPTPWTDSLLDPGGTYFGEGELGSRSFEIIWNPGLADQVSGIAELQPPSIECDRDRMTERFPDSCLNRSREIVSDRNIDIGGRSVRFVERDGVALETTATVARSGGVVRVVGECEWTCVRQAVELLREVGADDVPRATGSSPRAGRIFLAVFLGLAALRTLVVARKALRRTGPSDYGVSWTRSVRGL